ncbi:MAG: PaaI family thioesterase [Bacteroidales bacterium]
MRKVVNPFDRDMNRCFGCGPNNPAGLKLEFMENKEELHSFWQPSEYYQGYPGVLHGGIIATLLDEIAAWFVYAVIGTSGVTSRMNIKYLHPVMIKRGKVKITAKLTEKQDKKAQIICRLFDGSNKLCAEAEVIYYIYPIDIAASRFMYPGKEAFYTI